VHRHWDPSPQSIEVTDLLTTLVDLALGGLAKVGRVMQFVMARAGTLTFAVQVAHLFFAVARA
jgi:hypothetical protein